MSANTSETHWQNVPSLPVAGRSRKWQPITCTIHAAEVCTAMQDGVQRGKASHSLSTRDVCYPKPREKLPVQ